MNTPAVRWEDLVSAAETALIAADMDRGTALLDQRVWDSAARKWVPRVIAAQREAA